jgi:hypothetical protein
LQWVEIRSFRQAREDGLTERLSILNASDATEAQHLLNAALRDGPVSHARLAVSVEKHLLEGFAVFDLPEGLSGAHAHHQRIGVSEQGAQAANPCGDFIPQHQQLSALGERFASRTR